jgi:plasmid maintenance system killer protein
MACGATTNCLVTARTAQLDAALALRDLDLPGNRLEALKGDRKGQYSLHYIPGKT